MIFMLKIELHSKVYKRLKISSEGGDYGHRSYPVTKHDNFKHKQQQATSRILNDSEPSDTPNLVQVLDTSMFGSVGKEIEALCARRSQLLKHDVARNPRLPFTRSNVSNNRSKEPGKLVNQRATHLTHKNIIDVEDDCMMIDAPAVVPTVVDLSSDDEDGEHQRRSNIYQKVVLKPVGKLLMKDSMNIQKSKVVKEQVESMNGKVNINKFRAKDDVEIDDDSHQPFQEKESNYETNTADHSLKDIQRKAPSKEVRNVSYTVDIRIEKDEYDGSRDDVVIENDNHQIHQKEEYNLQTYAEDNGLENICKKMAVTSECSEEKESNYETYTVDHRLEDIRSIAPRKEDILRSKAVRDKVESINGKFDIRIDKGGNFGAEDVVVEENSHQSFWEKESNYETNNVNDRLEYKQSKAPSKKKEEHNLQTDAEDDGLVNMWNGVIVALECPKDYHIPLSNHAKGGAQSLSYPAKGGTQQEEARGELEIKKEKGVYVGVEDEDNYQTETENDGLQDIWKEMSMALECSKNFALDPSSDVEVRESEEDCDHSFVLKDDLGYLCRICGVIDRGIETIFEFQYNKYKRSTRTHISDSWNGKDRDSTEMVGVKFSEDDLTVTDISAHPRHMKQMKLHQEEGFNFLVSNLVGDNPGGCILAHAPGSGKTFMIISFMQSFLGKYPQARPLVVLPKGILATWKKEFKTWQVEDIPLYDFYTAKAENRSQQLEVLHKWVEHKSILFLGYKQFSTIVCDDGNSEISTSCQEILLKVPSILILDEGHTPRNENTDVLQSLAKVQTPRKVVLSGTLYQNHVKEVFNIINLVRPKFLRMETSRSLVKRIMSRVDIPGARKQFKAGSDSAFYDLVEHTLQKDQDFRRKVTVIQDLREMTSKILHYYKGDFLDELPGLVDFTVILNLSSRQKLEVQKLKKMGRNFKISSVGSAVYLHPKLNSFSENQYASDHMVDEMIGKLDVSEGVKAKFFLNMLSLCESAGEKLLVFSQYLLPLKFLERLAVKMKGWSLGRELFVITGDSSSDHREWSMEQFNNSPDAKVFFGSIKACGEGISLVGASRVIIMDIHLNPSVTRQAIGRAFRPGQKKKVFVYRLVAADSLEEEDHSICFKKELISKMWFEWDEYCGYQDFEVETIDVKECGDLFLESSQLGEDIDPSIILGLSTGVGSSISYFRSA
uniref:Uncharacterized protein n=1 Tax=Quercus lobata TaxID=97700 RepID=A0A7N2MXV8_QUELO